MKLYIAILTLAVPLAANAIAGSSVALIATRSHVSSKTCDEDCKKEAAAQKAERDERMRKRDEAIATPSKPKPAIEEKKRMAEKLMEVKIMKGKQ